MTQTGGDASESDLPIESSDMLKLSPILTPSRDPEPLPFPLDLAQAMTSQVARDHDVPTSMHRPSPDRRMHVLANQLDCLGYFDHDPHGPHAA
jgi:hypothetical protein